MSWDGGGCGGGAGLPARFFCRWRSFSFSLIPAIVFAVSTRISEGTGFYISLPVFCILAVRC